ncbi:diguanylate cyclase [Cohaesibacter sp. CAU 1516]|uniref:GGDEF domain-containing response regulator n=1 Tax=Cohaesibacter sp. CAU 1516 TaxID=2576038 RepID=UPI0010FD970C|nr:diguanylate cyclase [Cohaesibacter sp. CAU 1516]TLP47244.1 diguanylate cyclase [Cohaesibacter sp. CAU 1516]
MKIVLVEAKGAERSAIRSMLEKRQETVYAFSKGQDAWSFIEQTPDINIIIVSLNDEGMSGLEICWNARILAEQRKGMYVIAISGEDNDDMLVEALDSGADDYLQRPLQEEILLARLRVAERMIVLQQQLVQLANHDSLTELLNRRAFFEHADLELSDPEKSPSIHAIMFDIDHFKRVNDSFGHDAGDQVIRTVAKIAQAEGDLIGRLGGEEFAMILSDQSTLGAARSAERMRETIENTPILINGHRIEITSSFGVASYQDGDSVDELLKRADIALYRSKNEGRNRVSVDRPHKSVIEDDYKATCNIRQKSRA